MTPKQLARQQIDDQLAECGWIVQNHREMNISAGLGVAIREFPLKTGEADYLLYADGKAIGVVEAKPVGHSLTGVETQSGKYLEGLPENLPHYGLPLRFAYESTGAETRFSNYLEPDDRSRPVFTFHRPEELLRLVKLDEQTRTLLRQMDVHAKTPAWQPLPDFPGTARQGLFSAVVNDSLYFWGGFSYAEPFCYADGWRLRRTADMWNWQALPPLP